MSDEFTIAKEHLRDDTKAAAAVKITWLIEPHTSEEQQSRKVQTERLCREAIEGGFVRAVLGRNPVAMCVR